MAEVYLDVDRDELDLVVAGLQAEAKRRSRAAMMAAGELETEAKTGAVADKRRPAVRIVGVLNQAAKLEAFAKKLVEAFEHPAKDNPDADPETPEAPRLRIVSDEAPGEKASALFARLKREDEPQASPEAERIAEVEHSIREAGRAELSSLFAGARGEQVGPEEVEVVEENEVVIDDDDPLTDPETEEDVPDVIALSEGSE